MKLGIEIETFNLEIKYSAENWLVCFSIKDENSLIFGKSIFLRWDRALRKKSNQEWIFFTIKLKQSELQIKNHFQSQEWL